MSISVGANPPPFEGMSPEIKSSTDEPLCWDTLSILTFLPALGYYKFTHHTSFYTRNIFLSSRFTPKTTEWKPNDNYRILISRVSMPTASILDLVQNHRFWLETRGRLDNCFFWALFFSNFLSNLVNCQSPNTSQLFSILYHITASN